MVAHCGQPRRSRVACRRRCSPWSASCTTSSKPSSRSARFGVTRLDVFGSALRDDFRPGESDVDLLVEFAPMEPRELADAYFGLLYALRELLGEVDLVMSDAVTNPYIAREIERTKQLLYAA